MCLSLRAPQARGNPEKAGLLPLDQVRGRNDDNKVATAGAEA
jgi:hypothetical protein